MVSLTSFGIDQRFLSILNSGSGIEALGLGADVSIFVCQRFGVNDVVEGAFSCRCGFLGRGHYFSDLGSRWLAGILPDPGFLCPASISQSLEYMARLELSGNGTDDFGIDLVQPICLACFETEFAEPINKPGTPSLNS